MEQAPVSKLDKICHEIFASTLRANYTSPRDEEPTSKRLLYAEKIAALANKLSDPKTLRLNLLKAPMLRKIGDVEREFLKAAMPTLICSARPYNTQYVLEKGGSVLNRWAGITDSIDSPPEDVTELFISSQAFKNTLLKLLVGNSDDNRVVNMRNMVNGVPWSSSDVEGAQTAVDDDAECTFHPKINRYPKYLKNAPKPRFPKNTIGRRLKDFLETPQPRHGCEEYYDDNDELDLEITADDYGPTDYSSPFNNRCPLTTPIRRYADRSRQEQLIPTRKGAMDCRVGDGYMITETHRDSYNGISPKVDEIDELLSSLPRLDEKLFMSNGYKGADTKLRFVTPHRSHLYSEIGCVPPQCDKDTSSPWQDLLRGGYLPNSMRFSIDHHRNHDVEHSNRRYVGSMKGCDFVLPQTMAAPMFTRSRGADLLDQNEAYYTTMQSLRKGNTPLDILEAQLAQPIINVMKLRC